MSFIINHELLIQTIIDNEILRCALVHEYQDDRDAAFQDILAIQNLTNVHITNGIIWADDITFREFVSDGPATDVIVFTEKGDILMVFDDFQPVTPYNGGSITVEWDRLNGLVYNITDYVSEEFVQTYFSDKTHQEVVLSGTIKLA